MPERDEVRLRHMLDASRKAVEFTDDRTRTDLDTDEMLALAVVRLVEIVGEAAKSVSVATRAQIPALPWRSVTGTRDHLVHGYHDVDLDIVWEIVRVDLPSLIQVLEAVLGPDI